MWTAHIAQVGWELVIIDTLIVVISVMFVHGFEMWREEKTVYCEQADGGPDAHTNGKRVGYKMASAAAAVDKVRQTSNRRNVRDRPAADRSRTRDKNG